MHRNAFQQRPKKHSTVFEMDNRLRKSVLELDKKEVKLLTQAFEGIMNLPYYHEHSYFTLASWHGIGANMCPHHDQLFLSWHRKYLRLFEDALRSVPGCETVTLPYWDATSDDPSVPEWLSTYPFDSFDLRKSFSQDDWPKVAQEIHDKFGYDVDWFNDPTTFRQKDFPSEIQQLLQSNQVEINITTAMNSAVWSGISNDSSTDVGIEVAHDGIHDAVGGWMGQPALAAFDPIFWFHHSNVDRLFKVWQQQKNATTVEALNALRGEYEIPWDVSFSTRDSLSLSVSRDSFTGSFRELVSKPDISYTTGSFAKVSDRLPLRASFGLVSRSADAVAVGPVVVTASNLLCLRVKDIDRSKIKGSFTVRVSIGKHTTIDIPAFQKGIGCDNCEANKLFSVHTFLPTSTVKPNDRIVIKLIQTHLLTSHEEEITNFGQPEVDIRLLVQ